MTHRRSLRGPLIAVALGALLAASCSSSAGEVERAELEETTTAPSTSPSTAGESDDSDEVDASDEDVTLRIGLHGIDSFDPAAASPAMVGDVVLVDLLYDSLTVIDDAGVAQPGLASFSANADQTVWRFELDRGAIFADGAPVTADDVSFSLERVLAGGRGSLAALRLDQITSISTSGTTTVDVEMAEPSAVLPELLASPVYGITSRATIEQAVAGGDATPNPSSPYTASFDGVDRLTLERRIGDGPTAIVVDLFATEGEALDAFLDGDLDWTTAPPDRIGEASEAVGSAGIVPFHGGLMLGVDAGVAPLGSDDLRRAIALAIDRQAIADAVFGPTAGPALGLIPEGVPGGDSDACRGVCGPSRDEAATLVARAFPDGQAQPLRLLVDEGQAMRGVAGVIEDQLSEVGIEVETTPQPVPTYESLIAAGQQQLFVFGWLGVSRTPASHLPPLFDSASPDNVTGLADAGIDEILRAALREPIPSVRASIWRSVETAILERVPVVPLVQFRTTGVLNPRVSGFEVRADGSVDLAGVSVAD